MGGLGFVVGAFGERGFGARGPLRHQLQRGGPRRGGPVPLPLGGAGGQDPVRQPHHLRSGAVVADQLDDVGVREPLGELEQVPGRGAGERVDGLAGVAHHAELVAGAQPQVQEPLLQRGNVLVFVHHEVPVLVADHRGHALVFLQDPHHDQQDVLKVDDVAVHLHVLVGLEDAGDGGEVESRRRFPVRRGTHVAVRSQHGYLRPFDFSGDVADGGPVRGQTQPPGRLGDDLGLVVQQPRHGTAHGVRPEVLQLLERRGVEGFGLDAVGAEVPQPGAHFRRRPGGEGHRQHLLGFVDAGGHAVCHAVGDGTGLAGAGAGQDAERARQGGGDGALLIVESGQDACFG